MAGWIDEVCWRDKEKEDTLRYTMNKGRRKQQPVTLLWMSIEYMGHNTGTDKVRGLSWNQIELVVCKLRTLDFPFYEHQRVKVGYQEDKQCNHICFLKIKIALAALGDILLDIGRLFTGKLVRKEF